MTEWAFRVFWTAATVAPAEGGYAVLLDGRPVRTPGKASLTLPSRALAEAVAEEWAAQRETVAPTTMPVTRLANSAIDKVTAQFDEVAQLLAAYGGSDLLCYRADHPAELVARQAAGWDPLLDWAADRFDAPLTTTAGIMHVDQPPDSLARLAAEVAALTPFELAAFHDLVAIPGSLVLGLAAVHEVAPPEELWALSRIDEEWQAEQWGSDEEAEDAAARKRADFLQAHRTFDLVRAP